MGGGGVSGTPNSKIRKKASYRTVVQITPKIETFWNVFKNRRNLFDFCFLGGGVRGRISKIYKSFIHNGGPNSHQRFQHSNSIRTATVLFSHFEVTPILYDFPPGSYPSLQLSIYIYKEKSKLNDMSSNMPLLVNELFFIHDTHLYLRLLVLYV